MWGATLIRGPEAHCITKVKGHATAADVEKQLATQEDKEGNDEADDCATRGVKTLGLTNVTLWLARRHEAYIGLMERIHIMIIRVLQKEKEERNRRAEERNFVNGFDETKFAKTDGSIKAQLAFEGPSSPLRLQPPAKGNHRLAKVQFMYEDVSRFLTEQTWRTPKEETRASGTTWLELFILFDTMGYRRKEGRTPKNVASTARTKERNARIKHKRKGRCGAETSEPRASLAEELEAFKRIVRHTTRQDGDAEQAKWFHGDTKPQYRRLKGLGITEHQPAIAANCEVDPITMMEIEEAIVMQKARCTPKQLKHFKDARLKIDEVGPFLIRMPKVEKSRMRRYRPTQR